MTLSPALFLPAMRLLYSVLLIGLGTIAHGQHVPQEEFAMSLAPTSDGRLFTLFIVKMRGEQIVQSRPITRENFIRQAQGRAFSAANPEAEDLFRKYDVEACTLPPDSAAMGFLTDCITLDDLWKLRYWEYPVYVQDSRRVAKGWSERPRAPSHRQMEILGEYGLRFINSLVVGPDFFHLLRDMGNPEWVNNYRGN